MLKVMQKSACALAVLAVTATSVMATESVDVKVIGTITPDACSTTISGGGVADYGTIKANVLSSDNYTILDEKKLKLTISCDAPTKVAVKAIDGRLNSLAGATEGAAGAGLSPISYGTTSEFYPAVGLGLDGERKIGGYSVFFSDVTIDSSSDTTCIIQREGNPTWSNNYMNSAYDVNSVSNVSWKVGTGDNTPASLTNLSGTVSIKGFINKASELDLTHDIQLDGLTTIELVYL